MKKSSFLLGSLAVLVSLASVGCQSVSAVDIAARKASPVRLQVSVDVPPSMNSIRDDDIAAAFGQDVSTALHQQGFKGRIKFVDEWDEPATGIPSLAINLMEWRVSITGMVDCTFSASLKTPAGTKVLGLFTGTAMRFWGRRDWFARADGFHSAANDSLSQLLERLEQTGLITKVPSS